MPRSVAEHPKPAGPRTLALRQIPTARPNRIVRWRIGVLVTVHVLIVAHVLYWWATGNSLGRFVLSDTMRTLELGEVNPGAVLFAVSLLITVVFGRFMCGWLCHMGALQDVSAWVLRKAGLRPRIFRSRFLGFVPLALAIYMFVWPTVSREIAAPVARELWPKSAIAGTAAFPGFSSAWTTGDLWEGLPGVWLAIPFLLLCGFGMVWFFGARGLCRYGCPYGGFLLAAARVSPVRVKVDATKCDACGLCTAACTAGVRVLDQLKRFGGVIDHNCVRSFDCIAECPNGALTFGPGSTSPLEASSPEQTSRKYDLGWGEEFLCMGVFGTVFFVSRGLYGVVPLLMAATLGALCAFVTWKALRICRDDHVRLMGAQLKIRSSVTRPGVAFIVVAVALGSLIIHSAVVRGALVVADRHDSLVTVSFSRAVSGEAVDESQLDEARRAVSLYRLAGPISRGGLGLATTPEAALRLAWLRLVMGEQELAIAELHTLIDSGRANETHLMTFADLLLALGRGNEAEELLSDGVAQHAGWSKARCANARLLASSGDMQGGEALLNERLASAANDGKVLATRGLLRAAAGRTEEGVADLARAREILPNDAEVRIMLANQLARLGRLEDAMVELRDGASRIPAARDSLLEMERRVGMIKSRTNDQHGR